MLVTSMSMLDRLVPTHLHPGEVVLHLVQEELHDPVVQCGLIRLDRQYIVGLRLDDLAGDLRLTAHGVDGHQAAGDIQQFQQLGDGGDLVALLIDDDLTQADVVGGGPVVS